MDINDSIFPVSVFTLTKKIKRPFSSEYYNKHFFTRLIESVLVNRSCPTDSNEILAVKINDRNAEHFYWVFQYLERNGNAAIFKLPKENKPLLLGLLETVSYYEIDGLKEIILNLLKSCIDKELLKLKASEKNQKLIPVYIKNSNV